jgi:hypothetical protein
MDIDMNSVLLFFALNISGTLYAEIKIFFVNWRVNENLTIISFVVVLLIYCC